MVVDASVILTWILFIALFPIAFFWLRRAWRIGVRRDYSEVALKRGASPPDPRKYAPYEMALNLAAGFVIVGVIAGILVGQLEYDSWSAIAGSTIWIKFFVSFALSRQAHASRPRSP